MKWAVSGAVLKQASPEDKSLPHEKEAVNSPQG